jgi:hypothetical protein
MDSIVQLERNLCSAKPLRQTNTTQPMCQPNDQVQPLAIRHRQFFAQEQESRPQYEDDDMLLFVENNDGGGIFSAPIPWLSSTSTSYSAKKLSLAFDAIKRMVPFFYFAFFLVLVIRGSVSIQPSSPTTVSANQDIMMNEALLDQLSKLSQDITSYNELKLYLDNDEIERSWDKQHISELEETITAMSKTFHKNIKSALDENKSLKSCTKKVREALRESMKQNEQESSSRPNDQVVATLTRQIIKANARLKDEHDETVWLKAMLAEKMEELQELKSNLRGGAFTPSEPQHQTNIN